VKTLTSQQISEALRLLGQFADDRNESIELIIVGGSAMVLLFGSRDSTEDVDAVAADPEQKQLVQELAGC